ncbi:MAG: hypothetical protein ACP5PJ_01945 [Acidimicrobiales bacterium]
MAVSQILRRLTVVPRFDRFTVVLEIFSPELQGHLCGPLLALDWVSLPR